MPIWMRKTTFSGQSRMRRPEYSLRIPGVYVGVIATDGIDIIGPAVPERN
jgi:hypothetical protein